MREYTWRPEIDGLRAIAVLAVIVNHLDEDFLPSGHLGVDVFFVISGYVITESLKNKFTGNVASDLIDFYSRRIKRLFPALATCVVVTGFVACLFERDPSASLRTGLLAIVGLSNFYLVRTSSDYFGSSVDYNYFTQTWSLAVEEQFYLIYPLLFLALYGSGFFKQRVLAICIALLSAFSLLIFFIFFDSHPTISFYLMPFRFWEIGMGCVLSMASIDWIHRASKNFLKALSILSVITIFGAFLFPRDLGFAATVIIVLSTLMMIMSTTPGSSIFSLLTCRGMIFIGKISYSLYLWHWSVIVLFRFTLGMQWAFIPMQVALMFAMASMSYYWIENPLRNAQWSKRKIFDILIPLSFSIFLAAGYWIFLHGKISPFYLGQEMRASDPKSHSKILPALAQDLDRKIQVAEWMKQKNSCLMTPHHLRGERYRPAPEINVKFLDECLKGERKKIILLGDSFSNVISDHVAHAAYEIGYDFRMVFGYGCPYPLAIDNVENGSKKKCEVNETQLQTALFRNVGDGDIIILRLYFQNPQYIDISGVGFEKQVDAYDREIENLYQIARRKGAGILIVGTNGTIDGPCLHRQWYNKFQCSGSTIINMDGSSRNSFAILLNRHLSSLGERGDPLIFEGIDPIHIYCEKSGIECPIEDEKTRFMRDRDHLSKAAVDEMYPELLNRLNSLVFQFSRQTD